MRRGVQAATGLALASVIAAAFLVLHVAGVFLLPLHGTVWLAAPPLILVQAWLGAGLFIVAHDAMHGSLAPGSPRLNRWIGRISLALYAAFPFDVMARKHFLHHRHAGSAKDPDFHVERPESFWPWYLKFFREYFGWSQLIIITAVYMVYRLAFGVSVPRVLLFWAAPALLSSLQLFVFGTWLPHRRSPGSTFADRHHARSLDYGWWLSLLTCFHFGYHLEHHHSPQTPWWALPRLRRLGRFTPG